MSGNLFDVTFSSIDCFDWGEIKVAELIDRYFKYTYVMLSHAERTNSSQSKIMLWNVMTGGSPWLQHSEGSFSS